MPSGTVKTTTENDKEFVYLSHSFPPHPSIPPALFHSVLLILMQAESS